MWYKEPRSSIWKERLVINTSTNKVLLTEMGGSIFQYYYEGCGKFPLKSIHTVNYNVESYGYNISGECDYIYKYNDDTGNVEYLEKVIVRSRYGREKDDGWTYYEYDFKGNLVSIKNSFRNKDLNRELYTNTKKNYIYGNDNELLREEFYINDDLQYEQFYEYTF